MHVIEESTKPHKNSRKEYVLAVASLLLLWREYSKDYSDKLIADLARLQENGEIPAYKIFGLRPLILMKLISLGKIVLAGLEQHAHLATEKGAMFAGAGPAGIASAIDEADKIVRQGAKGLPIERVYIREMEIAADNILGDLVRSIGMKDVEVSTIVDKSISRLVLKVSLEAETMLNAVFVAATRAAIQYKVNDEMLVWRVNPASDSHCDI